MQADQWHLDPEGNPRGYIQPKQLKELWFHTGTVYNLRCSFCLEGSKPGGEFYFSDIYSDRRIPESLLDDPVLYGDDVASVSAFVGKHSGEKIEGLKLRYLKYDWSLNEQGR